MRDRTRRHGALPSSGRRELQHSPSEWAEIAINDRVTNASESNRIGADHERSACSQSPGPLDATLNNVGISCDPQIGACLEQVFGKLNVV
jgi:hypothetical protein